MKNEQNNLDILRHSTAHILAAAVLEMFPEAKFGIGPSIENGFYYDFDLPRTLIPEDLPLLEEKMRAIIAVDYPFEKSEVDIETAAALFQKADQPYKTELLDDLEKTDETAKITLYKSGPFVDLCRGPHLASTGLIKPDAFKLIKISGAYWRGSEKNKMLQRIYGAVWESKEKLDDYLCKIEEAEKRDHRKIGRDLDLFSFHDAAPGIPFFHPKGSIIYNELKKFWQEAQAEFNYEYVICPSMLDIAIWKKSGHWDHYKDDMYFIKAGQDEKEYALRPMDCPGAILIYNNTRRSYRELPLRYAEPGLITRKEKSGQLNGLFRVQQFVQDDAHIFLTENQIAEEIKNVISLVDKIYRPFGLQYRAFLSTRPDDFMGTVDSWNKAETALKTVLDEIYGADNYGIKDKDGAFYGPKIDYQLEDALGRTWQCATIQLDFQMPEKFHCRYIDQNGKEQTPVLIHRTVMGAFERFMGILIEHYGGAFPVWLAPEQVRLLPIAERHKNYAEKIAGRLQTENIRAKIDADSETVGKRIRAGELQKIPYLLIIGDKEIDDKTVSPRQRGQGDLGAIKIEKFIDKISEEISEKILR